MTHHILVVDDDPHIQEVISFALKQAGHSVTIARDGREGLEQYTRQKPDLIVLDVGMPEMDGLELCRQIRKSSETPILFLSARDEEIDRILGLELGGDDYVTKPFSPRELVARVRAILKRLSKEMPEDAEDEQTFVHGRLTLNAARHVAKFDGTALNLTALEFAILKGLMARPTFVFTREQIINMAYSHNIHVADRTVDSHIRNIRAKFSSAGCASVVETVHGIGFRLSACESD
ncbi:MAG: response regulator transcription factor [Hyphomicrobiaceae bacterium]|nr:response regulator transcription factor [Hyphomicrobiaceae bacterium]